MMIVMMYGERPHFHHIVNLQVGERILCRHPFNESKRAYVVPQKVEELLKCYWPGSSGGDYPMVFGDVQFLSNLNGPFISSLFLVRPMSKPVSVPCR